jgi:hypothetical protein
MSLPDNTIFRPHKSRLNSRDAAIGDFRTNVIIFYGGMDVNAAEISSRQKIKIIWGAVPCRLAKNYGCFEGL